MMNNIIHIWKYFVVSSSKCQLFYPFPSFFFRLACLFRFNRLQIFLITRADTKCQLFKWITALRWTLKHQLIVFIVVFCTNQTSVTVINSLLIKFGIEEWCITAVKQLNILICLISKAVLCFGFKFESYILII